MSISAFSLSTASFLAFIAVAYWQDHWRWDTALSFLLLTGFLGVALWVLGAVSYLLQKQKNKYSLVLGSVAVALGLLGYFYVLPTFSW